MLFAAISTATMGDQTILTGVTGRRFKIVTFFLVAAGSVVVTWKSAASGTVLSGAMSMIVGVPFSPAPIALQIGTQPGIFETLNQGDALVLNLSGAVQVSGFIAWEFCP